MKFTEKKSGVARLESHIRNALSREAHRFSDLQAFNNLREETASERKEIGLGRLAKAAPKRGQPTIALLLFLAAGGQLISLGAEQKQVEVNVVVDMTPEGRKLAHPSAAHPAYYVPLVGGYTERGSPVAGEKPPAAENLMPKIEAALARQGYLVSIPTPYINRRRQVTYADGTVLLVPEQPIPTADGHQRRRMIPLTLEMMNSAEGPYSAKSAITSTPNGQSSVLTQIMNVVDPVHGAVDQHRPSIMLVVHWGYSSPTQEKPSKREQQDAVALVGGAYASNIVILTELEPVLSKASEDRYFIYITAFDFDSYLRLHKKVTLWQAKVSVPWYGVTFDDVLPVLVSAAEPLLGRETNRPQLSVRPIVQPGNVLVGTPEVKDDQNRTLSSGPGDAPPAAK